MAKHININSAKHDPAEAAFLIPNPRVSLPLPPVARLIVRAVSCCADTFGFWQTPCRLEGDFPAMTLFQTDKDCR